MLTPKNWTMCGWRSALSERASRRKDSTPFSSQLNNVCGSASRHASQAPTHATLHWPKRTYFDRYRCVAPACKRHGPIPAAAEYLADLQLLLSHMHPRQAQGAASCAAARRRTSGAIRFTEESCNRRCRSCDTCAMRCASDVALISAATRRLSSSRALSLREMPLSESPWPLFDRWWPILVDRLSLEPARSGACKPSSTAIVSMAWQNLHSGRVSASQAARARGHCGVRRVPRVFHTNPEHGDGPHDAVHCGGGAEHTEAAVRVSPLPPIQQPAKR